MAIRNLVLSLSLSYNVFGGTSEVVVEEDQRVMKTFLCYFVVRVLMR